MKHYVIKRGFLDGFAGLTASVLSAMHAYVKHSKIRMMSLTDTAEEARRHDR